jgi:hypothetical protein
MPRIAIDMRVRGRSAIYSSPVELENYASASEELGIFGPRL